MKMSFIKISRSNTIVKETVLLTGLVFILFSAATLPFSSAQAVDRTTPIVLTRGHFQDNAFSNPSLTSGHTATDYDTTGDIPGLQVGDCPPEIVIYIHGFDNTEDDAKENFNIAKKSLEHNNYRYPVVGFSWDSNPGVFDFNDAKFIATQNGKKLAQFIIDFKSVCGNTNVRIIGHSMGARVTLNTLDSLRNRGWNGEIKSVHVMGAAVDNEEVSKDPSDGFGLAIEDVVSSQDKFHNFYNPEDDVLSNLYWFEEADQALGEDGAESGIPLPSNYAERDVSGQIVRDTDGDGDNDESNLGDNHSGYVGVVNSAGVLTDDGAMDLAVRDWTLPDVTPPVIKANVAGTAVNNDWYTSDVTVSWDVNDVESQIQSRVGCDTTIITQDTTGQTLTCQATSAGGTATQSVTIKRDATNPEITAINGDIADGSSFYFGDVPAAPTCEATDATSGLDGGCTVTGYRADVGTHTLAARAVDNAGNEATRQISYTVLAWTIEGFYPPVDMNDIVNTVKSGQTVPLRFEIFAGENEKTRTGNDVIASFKQGRISCSSISDEPTDPIEVTTTGGTQLRYSDGQYTQNWKTPSNSANTCWKVTLTTADGSSISANFRLSR
jgi:pimeloyl-ACP methyl ester carboxylesterase